MVRPIIIEDGGIARDCILASKTSVGTADFIGTAGMTITLEASTTDPFEYDIGGRKFRITANKTVVATNNAHNFVWIDDTMTLGVSALPCRYLWTAPTSPATDQHWYDLAQRKMKRWSSTAWVEVSRIFVGYGRADSGVLAAQNASEQIGITPLWRVEHCGEAQSGFLDLSTGTTTIDGNAFYAAVVMRATAILNHTADDNRFMCIRSQGVFMMLGSSSINLNGLGRVGAAGANGAGAAATSSGNGGGGGGGGGGSSGVGGAGGGRARISTNQTVNSASGGAVGAVGSAGLASSERTQTAYYSAAGAMETHGAGGGGGGGTGSAAGGNGGAGGGGIVIVAPVISWASGTSMTANGANGVAGGGLGRGGGGGGGGGTIRRWFRGYFNNGTESANGGTGGAAGGGTSGAGGSGGAGLLQATRI